MVAAYKTPLVFSIDNKPYSICVRGMNAWKELTVFTGNKQGLAVALSLPENDVTRIRDAVLSDVAVDYFLMLMKHSVFLIDSTEGQTCQ